MREEPRNRRRLVEPQVLINLWLPVCICEHTRVAWCSQRNGRLSPRGNSGNSGNSELSLLPLLAK